MRLRELDTPFETKRVLMLNSKRDKAVFHNMEVRHVIGNVYIGKKVYGDRGQESNDLFAFFDEVPAGLWITKIWSNCTLNDVLSVIDKAHLNSLADYMEPIKSLLFSDNDRKFFKILDIAFVNMFDQALADQMADAKKVYLEKRKQEDEKWAEHCKEERHKFVTEENEKAEKQVSDAIDIICNGGTLENFKIKFYDDDEVCTIHEYSIVNYLMRKFKIQVPLRTQGWINSKLVSVELGGENPGLTFRRKKVTDKCPDSVFEYLDNLIFVAQFDRAACLDGAAGLDEAVGFGGKINIA